MWSGVTIHGHSNFMPIGTISLLHQFGWISILIHDPELQRLVFSLFAAEICISFGLQKLSIFLCLIITHRLVFSQMFSLIMYQFFLSKLGLFASAYSAG
uniref:Uncharacterized protein n=1 Tax=Setaria viridis TaxID=4556 RepID=A0A4U6SZX1_SETVI|nr:hypothetical protein SEVIR_9G320350v2 [Setaria viridis]